MLDAIEQREQREGCAFAVLDLDDLTLTAGVGTVSAGPFAELLAAEDQRRDRLGDFHGRVAHTRRERRR